MYRTAVIKGYILPMFSNRQKYVMRYDSWEIPEAARENLVYGVRYSPFKAGNIEFIGIVGISQIDMIEKRLKVDSFGGRGMLELLILTGIMLSAGSAVQASEKQIITLTSSG